MWVKPLIGLGSFFAIAALISIPIPPVAIAFAALAAMSFVAAAYKSANGAESNRVHPATGRAQGDGENLRGNTREEGAWANGPNLSGGSGVSDSKASQLNTKNHEQGRK